MDYFMHFFTRSFWRLI